MSKTSTIDGSSMPAIKRLFEKDRPRTIDRSEVRDALRKFQKNCKETFSLTTEMSVDLELMELKQARGNASIDSEPDAIGIAAYVSDWSAHVVVKLDPVLIFRSLDAMFGGDPVSRRSAPERVLTSLEQSIAVTLARGMIEQLLSMMSATGMGVVRVGPANELIPANSKTEYVVAAYRTVEHGEHLTFVIPASAFESISNQNASEEHPGVQLVDPKWTQDFERNVVAIAVSLEATMEGPQVSLGTIADLRPGSVIEFSRDAMQNVILVSGGKPVFAGRLGQSRGMFTVLLDAPVKPSNREEAP